MPLQPFPELDRTSPTFPTDVDAFFGEYMPEFVPDINALEANVEAKSAATINAVNTAMAAGLANAATNAAQTAADRTQTGLDRNATSADRVQTGLDRTAVDAALASIADGPVASINGQGGVLTLKTVGGQALLGSGDIVLPSPAIARVARTSNTQLVSADTTKFIDITSGTFTQTFAAASVLGSGWYVYLRNGGTGDITLDPNAAELIDGLASYVMYPGEVRLVMCDGTALRSIVLAAFYRAFTTSGNFIKPPGYSIFEGLMWSGGNSGAYNSTSALPGAGGGCAPLLIRNSDIGDTTSVVIGAGGAARTATGAFDDVNLGGATSFGSIVMPGPSNSSVGGAFSPSAMFASVANGSAYGGGYPTGNGSTVYGGARGGGASSNAVVTAPGTTVYGGSGGVAVPAPGGGGPGGGDGSAPGGGGAGSTATKSGAGARGEVRIWGVI